MSDAVEVRPSELRPAVVPERLGPWLDDHAPRFGPLAMIERISGGHSNLTFRLVSTAGATLALRRPPLGPVQPTANDVIRESRIMAALAPTTVPVPDVVATCADPDVVGAPFYLMDFVDGHVLRDRAAAETISEAARRNVGLQIVDVLVDLHALAPADVGLDDFGPHDGYVERQLRRWFGQYQRTRTRDRPLLDQVHRALCDAAPFSNEATIVHGDYRVDNAIVGDHGEVRAILDWEISTLGDPLADLGLLCVYWPEPGERTLVVSTTTAGGFPTRDEIVARYAERSGRNVEGIEYYVAFGWWKLACIAEGVLARYSAYGLGIGADLPRMDRLVDKLASRADDCVRRL